MIQLNSIHKKEIDQRIETFSSLYPHKEAIYISGAITTGKDFISWFIKQGKLIENIDEYKKHLYDKVISKNLETIKDFTSILRTTERDQIIEPASFEVAEWTQPDYLYYWGQIITKCVRKIVFLDGWSFSNGCIYEYYIGLKNGLELIDQNSKILNQKDTIQLIKESINENEKYAINVEFQQIVLSEIEKYGNIK